MSIKKLYLIAYNVLLCAGWAGILAQIALHYINGGNVKTVYPVIRPLLVVCQTAAIMEIFHAVTGLVRSPVFTTVAQVYSRLFVLWGGLELGSKDVTESYFVTQMVIAWACSEIIRYSFYAFNLLGSVPFLRSVGPLLWIPRSLSYGHQRRDDEHVQCSSFHRREQLPFYCHAQFIQLRL